MTIKRIFLLLAVIVISLPGCAQNGSSKKIGGGCEGCEAIYENPVPFEKLSSSVRLPDFNEAGPKIEISGIVYHRDGKTPAKDVVLYVYHTDQTGVYPTKGDEKGWAKRHGYIRGWVKTDQNGFYQFYTLRPQAYPNRKDPAHIHITVKEPDKNEYWIDEYLFEDDPLLKSAPQSTKPRGGNGVVKLIPQKSGIAHATRHIILGLNVPDYPYAGLPKLSSGLEVGANCPAFDPLHLSGPDKGKKACPMCKYGYGKGVMVWFNHANVDHMKDFILALEAEMKAKGTDKLRVFLIFMNPFYKENPTDVETGIIGRKLREWCEVQKLEKVAMTWIPSPVDEDTAGLYNINPQAKNTVFVYKNRTVTAKWVNVEYEEETLREILTAI
jgi:protocatechuate 3,4-dioxygenase beta subunit